MRASRDPSESSRTDLREPPPEPHGGRRRGALRSLQDREYRLLFASFVVNQTGFWLSHVSLQGLMVDLTGNDPFQVGLLFFSLLVPALLFAPIAGVAADRFDRKTIMLLCYATVVLVAAALTGFTAAGVIAPLGLMLLGFVLGTTFAFAGPASMAVAANAVPFEDLPSAVALQSAANNLTRVIGPLLAAPLVAAGHYSIGFGTFAVAAAIAGLLVSRMRVSVAHRDDQESGLLERLRSGWQHARERPPALAAIATAGSLAMFGVAHIAMLPVYAEQELGDRAFFPWIVATTAFGAMLGALVTGRDPRPTLGRAAIRLVLYGIALAVFASTRSVAVALGAQLFVGYFYFSVMTGLQTLLQQIVDDAKRGRIMSLFQLAWAGLTPIGSLAMGAAAGRIGIALTLQSAAAGCTLAGLYVTLRERR